MIHLTPAAYRRQRWANGRGTTTELYRIEDDGLLLRLSMATVSEDGPFSLFPGIERSLTVLSGPGFHLQGDDILLEVRPLKPVAFPGDLPLRATNVTAPSEDFNVMTAQRLPRPEVRVIDGFGTAPPGGLLAIFALSQAQVNATRLDRHDLVLLEGPADVKGPLLCIRLHGITHPV